MGGHWQSKSVSDAISIRDGRTVCPSINRQFQGAARDSFRQIDRNFPLLVLTRGELLYGFTLSSEGSVIAAHRFNGVVVRRCRHKVYHIHAVNHVREILIPPVKRFCRAIEVLGVRAVVHQRVLNQGAASIGRPTDNGGIIRRRFQRRSLDDPHARGFLSGWTLRRSGLGREDQDADRKRHRKCQK